VNGSRMHYSPLINITSRVFEEVFGGLLLDQIDVILNSINV